MSKKKALSVSLALLVVFLVSFPAFSLKLEKLARKDGAPTITLKSPKKDQTLSSAQVTIIGKVEDDKEVSSVRVNGVLLSISPGKEVKINQTMQLVEGKNTIKIEAMDSAGQATTLTRVINYSKASKKVFTVSQAVTEVKRVGNPLRIAVLSLDSMSQSEKLSQTGNILAEMLTTALGKTRRFDLMERSELERLLKEQGLSQSGFVDSATAKKIGMLAAVDALVVGTFSELTDSLRVDMRLIDTETAQIILTEGTQSRGKSTDDLAVLSEGLAEKVRLGFPLLEGKVLTVKDDGSLMIDIGKEKGLISGARFVTYREGEDIIIDGINYGKEIKVLGEILATDVQEKYALANLVKKEGSGSVIKKGDKVVTK